MCINMPSRDSGCVVIGKWRGSSGEYYFGGYSEEQIVIINYGVVVVVVVSESLDMIIGKTSYC